MNNPALAIKLFRRLSGGQQPSNIPSRSHASVFALLALAPVLAVLFTSSASAQTIQTAGQLLIDLNVQRGALTNVAGSQGMSTTGDPVSLTNWINYGTLGGAFNAINNSAYAATMIAASTNPPEFVTIGPDANGVSAIAPYTEDAAGSGVGRMMVASFLTPAQMQGNNPWSVELWFYSSSLLADPRGVFDWTLGAPAAGTDAGEIGGATTAFWAGSAGDANDVTWVPSGVVGTVSTAAPSLGTWHHGVVTYDGTTEKVYLDGNLSNSVPRTLNIDVENAHPLLFSQLNAIPATAASSAYDGSIAALRVHTGVLSLAQVQANFSAGIAAFPATDNSLYVQATTVTGLLGTPGSPNSATATLNASLLATGSPSTTEVIFFYDTTDHGATTNGWAHYAVVPAPNLLGSSPSAALTGLPFSTTYFVRAYAVDANNTNMSSAVTFTTVGPPIVNNIGAFFAGVGSDFLSGNLTSDGTGGNGAWIIMYYGTTDGGNNPGAWDSGPVNLGPFIPGVTFNFQVSSLAAGSINYFTFEATNIYGVTFASPSTSYQEGLIFALSPSSLPAASIPPAPPTPIASYPSSTGTFVKANGSATVYDFGGAPFVHMIGTHPDSFSMPLSSFPNGTPTPLFINGATLVAVLEPVGAPPQPGNTVGQTIASVYDTQFGLGLSGSTTSIIEGGSVASVTITSGGTGYTNAAGAALAPTVTFAAPGGMSANITATGTAKVSSAGVVTNVTITSGGSGYPWQSTGIFTNILPPTVTFSPPTIAGTTATGTSVMTTATGVELLAIVNAARPIDNAEVQSGNSENGYAWGLNGYGNNAWNNAWIPEGQISVVSIVAGSGLTGYGTPTPTGAQDNNYLIYVNGVLIEDTASGVVNSLAIGTAGAGYTPQFVGGAQIPLSFNTPTGGTAATGYAKVSAAGVVTNVTLLTPGAGYTLAEPPAINFPAPTGASPVQATFNVGVQSLGNYINVNSAVSGLLGQTNTGYNGGGMNQLQYGLPIATYASGNANSTYGIGDQAGTAEAGFSGYLGDVTIWGEALSPATLQTAVNAEGVKYISGATLSFAMTASVTGPGGSIAGPTTVVQGYNATYTITLPNGIGLNGLTDNGNPLTLTNVFTITNVSAAHTIVATTISIPPQTLTVNYTGSGVLYTNGLVVTSGTTLNYGGGASALFTFTVSPGVQLGPVTLDGTTISQASIVAAGGIPINNLGYPLTTGTAHTLSASFIALPSGPGIASPAIAAVIPESQALFFSVDTASLSTTTGSTIATWPMYYSDQNVAAMIPNTYNLPAKGVTYTDANGVVWEDNLQSTGNPGYQFYPNTVGNGVAIGTTLPNTGATIICVASPAIGGTLLTQPWNSLVDVFFGCMELCIEARTGLIQAMVDNDQSTPYDGTGSAVATSTYAIPNGTNVVLSLVAQTNGSFAVYANTVLVITNAGIAPHNLYMVSGHENDNFADNMLIGTDGPDGASVYNGLIGNTYFWTTALTTSERTNLEAALMAQFHAVVPPNFNWVGPNGGNFSSINNWSNTVPGATTAVPGSTLGDTAIFSLLTATPTPGLSVNLDVNEQFSALVFNSSTILSSTDGSTITLGDGVAASSITVTNGSPAIEVPVSMVGALTVNNFGTGTLLLSNTVNEAGAMVINLTNTGNGTVTFVTNLSNPTATTTGLSVFGSGLSGAGTVNLGGNTILNGRLLVNSGTVNISGNLTTGNTIGSSAGATLGNNQMRMIRTGPDTAAINITGGTVYTTPVSQTWTGTGSANGPCTALGGYDNSASSMTLSLSGGGTLVTGAIGCVTAAGGTLVPPSTYGATAIVNLNGGIIQSSASDLAVGAGDVAEAHLLFNTTHTWIHTGGATFNIPSGIYNSIAVPLEHYVNGPIIDGGLTLTGGGLLTNIMAATYTGPTVIQSGILAEETATSLGVNSVTIGTAPASGAQLQLDFAGTATVYQLIIGGTVMPPGVYGSSLASGLTTAPDNTDFAGVGSLTVLGTVPASGATPAFTSSSVTGNIGGGTGVLHLSGTGGILGTKYAVLTSANVAAPLSTWTTLTTGTFTSSGFSVSTPITAAPQAYITIVVQ